MSRTVIGAASAGRRLASVKHRSRAPLARHAELVRALGRDPAALEELYRRHVRPLTRYAVRRLGDPEAAGDLVAATFLAAIESAGRFDPERGEPAAWLYGIAGNLLANQRRRSAAESRALARLHGRRELPADEYGRLEDRLDAHRRAGPAHAALRVLPPAERDLDPSKVWHRHRIDVVILKASCRAVAVSTETWEDPDQPAQRPLTGRLRATPAPATGTTAIERYQRDPADPWSGCVEANADPDPTPFPTFEREGEVAAAWEGLASRLGTPMPPYADPRFPLVGTPPGTLPESVDALLTDVARADAPAEPPDGPELAGQWWVAFVRLVTSPQPDAAVRAAALKAAAARDDVVALPDVVVGETGRPGARLQIPYIVDDILTTAELLFDRDTGALRERVIHTDSAVQLTAYPPT